MDHLLYFAHARSILFKFTQNKKQKGQDGRFQYDRLCFLIEELWMDDSSTFT